MPINYQRDFWLAIGFLTWSITSNCWFWQNVTAVSLQAYNLLNLGNISWHQTPSLVQSPSEIHHPRSMPFCVLLYKFACDDSMWSMCTAVNLLSLDLLRLCDISRLRKGVLSWWVFYELFDQWISSIKCHLFPNFHIRRLIELHEKLPLTGEYRPILVSYG